MFVSQAHSFRQQARLAITLSWISGYTNIVTLLVCGQTTSHMTGSASQLGRDVAEMNWSKTGYILALLGVFFLGAALSGFLSESGRRRGWASIYVLPMAVEALILVVFAVLVDWNALGELERQYAVIWLTLLPALAMGLQNATVTRISGGVVRTTHVTGVLTDVGMESAIWVMGKFGRKSRTHMPGAYATGWRLVMLVSIIGSFAFGSACGTLAFDHVARYSMVPAVGLVLWLVILDVWHPIADIRTNAEVGGDLHDMFPPQVAVYHIDARTKWMGRNPRLPNLSSWGERLDDGVRVVLIDLTDVEFLDENTTHEIGVLAQRLQSRHTSLVLAGVTPKRYKKLKNASVLRHLDAYGNLDLAAARAMTILDEHQGRN
jgi:uncharacterized membrane protein YoaK (UPF0700 family)